MVLSMKWAYNFSNFSAVCSNISLKLKKQSRDLRLCLFLHLLAGVGENGEGRATNVFAELQVMEFPFS